MRLQCWWPSQFKFSLGSAGDNIQHQCACISLTSTSNLVQRLGVVAAAMAARGTRLYISGRGNNGVEYSRPWAAPQSRGRLAVYRY